MAYLDSMSNHQEIEEINQGGFRGLGKEYATYIKYHLTSKLMNFITNSDVKYLVYLHFIFPLKNFSRNPSCV